jgi:hypothetical protein
MYTSAHLEFRKQHSIFINPITGEIRCISCKIEIYDFDQMSEEDQQQLVRLPDPFLFRERYLRSSDPPLLYNTSHLENSAAHKKSNRGLCNLVDKNQHSVISSVVQFLSNVPFYKSIIKKSITDTFKSENGKLLACLFGIIKRIWTGETRSIPMSVFTILLDRIYQGWFAKKSPSSRAIKSRIPSSCSFFSSTLFTNNSSSTRWRIQSC